MQEILHNKSAFSKIWLIFHRKQSRFMRRCLWHKCSLSNVKVETEPNQIFKDKAPCKLSHFLMIFKVYLLKNMSFRKNSSWRNYLKNFYSPWNAFGIYKTVHGHNPTKSEVGFLILFPYFACNSEDFFPFLTSKILIKCFA